MLKKEYFQKQGPNIRLWWRSRLGCLAYMHPPLLWVGALHECDCSSPSVVLELTSPFRLAVRFQGLDPTVSYMQRYKQPQVPT